MENASKALIMAAGVLMGVLILSLAVYLFSTLGSQADNNYDIMRTEATMQFNSYYLAYDGRNDLTYYDIWSIVNKVNDYNSKDDGGHIDLEYIGGGIQSSDGKIKITSIEQLTGGNGTIGEIHDVEVLDEDGNPKTDSSGNKITEKQLKKYKCNVSLDNISGRVNKITFSTP